MKEKLIAFRVTDAQLQKLHALAAGEGTTISAMLRQQIDDIQVVDASVVVSALKFVDGKSRERRNQE